MLEEFKYYIIDGKVYDLNDWIPKHPGGVMWFENIRGRDSTAAIFTYHKSPDSIMRILK